MTAKVIAFPETQIHKGFFSPKRKTRSTWERACKKMTAVRVLNRSMLATCLTLNLACIGVSIFIVCTVLFL